LLLSLKKKDYQELIIGYSFLKKKNWRKLQSIVILSHLSVKRFRASSKEFIAISRRFFLLAREPKIRQKKPESLVINQRLSYNIVFLNIESGRHFLISITTKKNR